MKSILYLFIILILSTLSCVNELEENIEESIEDSEEILSTVSNSEILGRIEQWKYFNVSNEGSYGFLYKSMADTTDCLYFPNSCTCGGSKDSAIDFYNNSQEKQWSKYFAEEDPIGSDMNSFSNLVCAASSGDTLILRSFDNLGNNTGVAKFNNSQGFYHTKIELSDNGLIYLATVFSDSSGRKLEVFCTDSSGNKIWSYSKYIEEDSILEDISITENSELILAYQDQLANESRKVTLIKLNEFGNEIINKQFSFEDGAGISNITLIGSGELLLSGFVKRDPFAALLNQNLESIWENRFILQHESIVSWGAGLSAKIGFRLNDNTLRLFVSQLGENNLFQLDINNLGEFIELKEIQIPTTELDIYLSRFCIARDNNKYTIIMHIGHTLSNGCLTYKLKTLEYPL